LPFCKTGSSRDRKLADFLFVSNVCLLVQDHFLPANVEAAGNASEEHHEQPLPRDVLREFEHKLEADLQSVAVTLTAVTGVRSASLQQAQEQHCSSIDTTSRTQSWLVVQEDLQQVLGPASCIQLSYTLESFWGSRAAPS